MGNFFLDLIYHPTDRVYQVDQDCFLIYLGSDFSETAPFMRIGASKNFDPSYSDHVKYILLTDQLLQNFCYEIDCLKAHQRNKATVIGNEKQIQLFRDLLDRFKIKHSDFDELNVEIPTGKKQIEIILPLKRDTPPAEKEKK